MRVLLTRALDDATRTADRLRNRGHEPLFAPVLEIVPTDEPAPTGHWAGLVLTSAHAIPAARTLSLNGRPVFAVGARTGEIAGQNGLRNVLIASGEARSLSTLIRKTVMPPATLLHAAGRHRKAEPEASLREAGYEVLVWETYEAKDCEVLPEETIQALRAGNVDAVLHYSRRSADIFLRLAREADLMHQIATMAHLCLSDDVAEPFKTSGVQPRVAAYPDEDALLALLPR